MIAITKTDAARQQVFGWSSVALTKDGHPLVDRQDDVIDPDDLEDAAYAFNLQFRELNERHKGLTKGYLIESFVVTPEKLQKMGLPSNALPMGWWTGFYIPDAEVFAKVVSGEYAMFSVEGTASREKLE